jgi:hypothetical protein
MKLKKTARGTNAIIHIGIKFSLSAGPTFLMGIWRIKSPPLLPDGRFLGCITQNWVIRKISSNKSDPI